MKAFLLFLSCLFLLTACSSDGNKNGALAPAPVRTGLVELSNLPEVLTAVGSAQPSASVALIPRVTGEIQTVNFVEGQNVNAGDLLLQIDSRPYAAALREKEAILAKSRAQLAKARDDRRRFGKLAGNGYVSAEAYQQTETDAQALAATVQADRAAVESAALDLAYCDIKAPISGRIGALKLDKGNMVRSNANEAIANIDTISPCYVYFSVPEANLPIITDKMRNGVLEVMATPPGSKPEKGEVTLLDNNVDTKTGTIRLRGVFPNEDQRLWPGQFVNVAVALGEQKQVLTVPAQALQAGREESYVYVIDADNVARYHPAKPLFENGGKIAVESDLKAGQKVVTEGHMRLRPDVPVTVLD